VVVEASEKTAKRLVEQDGWHYLKEVPESVQTISGPVTPKKRGRPPKQKETND
jgi:AT hook motif.